MVRSCPPCWALCAPAPAPAGYGSVGAARDAAGDRAGPDVQDRGSQRAAGRRRRPLDAGPRARPLTGSLQDAVRRSGPHVRLARGRGGQRPARRSPGGRTRGLRGQGSGGRWVRRLADLPAAPTVLLDISPRQLAALGADGSALPSGRPSGGTGMARGYARSTGRSAARCPGRRRRAGSGTVHVGGTFEEVAASEAEVAAGRHPERPFCLVAQPGVVDATRAPAAGKRCGPIATCRRDPGGHDGAHRGANRALRARLPRPGPGPGDQDGGTGGGGNPNYVGGDITGAWPRCAKRLPAHGALGQLQDLDARPVPLLARPPPVAASTACAAIGRPARPWPKSKGAAERVLSGCYQGGASLPSEPPVITWQTPVITLPPLPPPTYRMAHA